MIYYLDTEFNGFGGEILSIALVPADKTLTSFYREFDRSKIALEPWVAMNVKFEPSGFPQETEDTVAKHLAHLFKNDRTPHVIADWPEDIFHLNRILLTGPGEMVPVRSLTSQFIRIRNWSTAEHSKVPHHALYDAIALRDYFEDDKKE